MSLFESIAEMGGLVVADDLACCGRRVYPPGQGNDPFRRMAESLLAAPPDPMRGSPIQDRLDHLVRLARTSGAKGVVFYDVKFCEPELYDLPDLRQGLQEAGIPSTAIEVDLSDPLAPPDAYAAGGFLGDDRMSATAAASLSLEWSTFWAGPFCGLQRWQAERRQAAALGLEERSRLAPPLKIAPRTKELVARHWLQGRYANLNRKVAWVTSGAPAELLKALDFYVLYPENHAAICGTARVAVDIATEAENAGYSRDICSYARTDIGALLSGKTPVGKLPRPDLLMACTNICQTVLFWYRVLAHHLHVPLILIDTPFVYYDAGAGARRRVRPAATGRSRPDGRKGGGQITGRAQALTRSLA